jgi:hypothetical protein
MNVAKLLTNREMELFRRVVTLAERMEPIDPQKSPSPQLEILAHRQAALLSFVIDEDDIAEVCETVTGS